MLVEFERKMPRVDPTAYIAPGAVLVGEVTVLAGASVWFNAVIRADFNSVLIGEGSNVQDNATAFQGMQTFIESGTSHHFQCNIHRVDFLFHRSGKFQARGVEGAFSNSEFWQC